MGRVPQDGEVNAEFGERVRLARLIAGLTQVELAAKLKCNAKTLYHWENGRTPRDPSLFVRFAQVTGTDVAWLYTGAKLP